MAVTSSTSGSGSGSTEQQRTAETTPLRSGYVPPAIRSAPAARVRSQEEIAALRALPYEKYLLTPWWRSRRNLALKHAGYRCNRCAAGRELQVHHVSYERRGDEADDDLQVLCRGCHLGHHVNEVTTNRSVYLAIVSAALKVETFESVPDLVEEVKRRCAALRVPYDAGQVQAAVSRLDDARLGIQQPVVSRRRAELLDAGSGNEPLTRAEAAGWMAKLGAITKSIPEVKVSTLREAERRKAARILAAGILEQIQVCEALEADEA